jgi:hypothetical protein
MVNAGDLLQLEYTPDLTEAGIAYACQRLAYIYNDNISLMYANLRQLVVDKAVELAFRRYLVQQGMAHKTVAATSANSLDPYHLLVGGWNCIIRTCWIDSLHIIQQVMAQPECLLQAGAVLPAERIIAWVPGEKDMYLFGYVTSHVAMDSLESNGDVTHRMLLLPGDWSRSQTRRTLGRLELTYRGSESLQIAMGGKGNSLALVSEHLVLHAGERAQSHNEFATLEYLYTAQPFTGSLGIYSSIQHRSYQVVHSAWKCLHSTGQAIYLGGFITHAEFARRSRRLDTGSQVFPGIQTQDKARLLWVRELHPLRELFELTTLDAK